MGIVKDFKLNKLETMLVQQDTDVDMAFVEMIFGDYKKAPMTKAREIKIITYADAESVGTTGDFYASSTVVCTEDGKTELKFRPPEINELVSMTGEDQYEVACDGDEGEKAVARRQKERAKPVGILHRRRERLMSVLGSQMAMTGEFKHHNGTVNTGFNDITVLAGGDKWDDATVSPIEKINEDYESMDEKPDAIFCDPIATKLILADARETDNTNSGKMANFARALASEIKEKSKSKTVRYVGMVLESGLEVYKVLTKVQQKDGTKTPLFGNAEVFYAPIGDRSAAKFVYGGIPQVSDALDPDPKTIAARERYFISTNETKTIARVGMLSSLCPVIVNPKKFKKVKVA